MKVRKWGTGLCFCLWRQTFIAMPVRSLEVLPLLTAHTVDSCLKSEQREIEIVQSTDFSASGKNQEVKKTLGFPHTSFPMPILNHIPEALTSPFYRRGSPILPGWTKCLLSIPSFLPLSAPPSPLLPPRSLLSFLCLCFLLSCYLLPSLVRLLSFSLGGFLQLGLPESSVTVDLSLLPAHHPAFSAHIRTRSTTVNKPWCVPPGLSAWVVVYPLETQNMPLNESHSKNL